MGMRRIAAALCALAAVACGAGSPQSPAAPSGATSIAVTGALGLTVGDSVQFKAMSSSGQDLTSGALWKTSDTTVARVSTLGVVLAVGPGSVIISASSLGVTGQTSVPVAQSIASAPTITRCSDIVAPGSYTVASDMSVPTVIGPCINIRSSGVVLTCADHIVSGVFVMAVSNVTVQHCTLQTPAFVRSSTNVTFHHNHLAAIYLDEGSGNTIRDNVIDGGYDGSGGLVGEDDGVVLQREWGDTISNNDIRNVWDAGIEGTDAITDTVIANNTIDNTGSVGISSYWCTAWSGNTVSGNSITRSPGLVRFVYMVSVTKCKDTSTVGVFVNNRFIGNRYSQPTKDLQSGGSMNFSLSPIGARVTNNLIQGNDMGSSFGPDATPENGFINGGGNICAANTSNFCGPGGAIRMTNYLVSKRPARDWRR